MQQEHLISNVTLYFTLRCRFMLFKCDNIHKELCFSITRCVFPLSGVEIKLKRYFYIKSFLQYDFWFRVCVCIVWNCRFLDTAENNVFRAFKKKLYLGLILCFLHLLGLKTTTEQWNKSLAGASASQQKKHTCSFTKATQNVSHICCPSCAILMVTATSMFLHYRVIFSKPLTGDIWRGVEDWM